MSQQRKDQQITAWAERVESMGLTTLVVPLLELARPLGFLFSQLILLGEPLLVGIGGQSSLRKTAEWLEDPERIDQLLGRLLDD